MSGDKQNEIHELAKQMSEAISTAVEQRYIEDEAKLRAVLIENGWRKASAVASEFIKDLAEFLDDNKKQMLVNGHSVWFINADDLTEFTAELKKKYTEDSNNG